MSEWINIGVTDKGRVLVFRGKQCEAKLLLRLDGFESDGRYYPILNIEGVDFDDLDKIREQIYFMLELFKKTLEQNGYKVEKIQSEEQEVEA